MTQQNSDKPDGAAKHQGEATQPTVSATGHPLMLLRRRLLAEHRWAVLVLPFLVYMLLGQLETAPSSKPTPQGQEDAAASAPTESSLDYPIRYTVRIALTAATILILLPGYREFPLRISPLAIGIGIVGVVIWVGLCNLDLESRLLAPLGLGRLIGMGERVAFNPFHHLGDRPVVLVAFLFIRFGGLAVIVPLIEEFFLRGFVLRFVTARDWWELAIGDVDTTAIIVATVYGILSHPSELFAAAAWFSLITWLMIRTRNIWDCVAAHAVTNLLLGIYVLISGDWALW